MAEAQQRISAAEFAEWEAFTRHEPLGWRRLDYLFAMLMAFLANLHRDPKKRRKPYRATDFLPDWWGTARRRSWRDLRQIGKMMAEAGLGSFREGS